MNIKNLFKRKQKDPVKRGAIYDKLIYTNNHIDIIHDACKICYDSKKEITREDKLNYIERRVKTGHDSILEHSNVILHIIIENNITSLLELVELITVCKYLNVKTETIGNETHILIGGSIRGYKHIIENISNQDNVLVKIILNNLYRLNKEYFYSYIEDNIMEEYKFIDLEDVHPAILSNRVLNENITITNMDEIYHIFKSLDGIFSIEDLLDMCTVTILLQDISRIISQQVTRHRNAITQLSQRYVNYSSDKFNFNSPAKYKDNYDVKYKYKITIGDKTSKYTLQELGNALMGIYNQLNDVSLEENRLAPEDARAYLPNNSQTSLYMTFTFKSLIKFLQLRTDKHAQAEIRLLAEAIEEAIDPILSAYILGDDIYSVLIPKYKREETYANIDEVIE